MTDSIKRLFRYVTRHLRSAIIAFFSLVLVLALVYPVIKWASNSSTRNYRDRSVTVLRGGLDNDLKYLTHQGDEVGKIPDLINATKARETLTTLSILTQEQKKRQVGAMAVTTVDGIVISRTTDISKSGDNVFISSSQGRAVVKNGRESSIELRTTDQSQLVLSTGRLLKEEGQSVGALFSSQLIDDTYSAKLRDSYLPSGSELAFYTYGFGLAGTSITNQQSKDILSSYLHPGSSWLEKGRPRQIVSLNGRDFFVETVTFPGLEESPGGVMLLIPSYGRYESLLIATFSGSLFLFLSLLIHKRYRRSEKYSNYLLVTLILMFMVFGIIYAIDSQLGSNVTKLDKPIYGIYNSTLSLVPSATVFDSKIDQYVDIRVTTGGESINSVSAVVNYDPLKAQIQAINTANSFCTLFPVKSIDNTKGQTTVSCGLQTPGLTATTGLVAELVLHALKPGTIALNLDPSSVVLANDGLGTNVLRATTNASYQAVESSMALSVEATGSKTIVPIKPLPEQITVYSPTHPNSEQWYSNRDVTFTWPEHKNYSYNYALDELPTTIPDSTSVTDNSFVAVKGNEDGVYYFHLQPIMAGVNGPTTNYKVMIDSTAPTKPDINVSSTEVSVDEVVRLVFSSTDQTSGLQGNYYLRLDEGLFLPTSPRVFIPFDAVGQHQITVRVFDNANNYVDNTVTIKVGQSTVISRISHFISSLLQRL